VGYRAGPGAFPLSPGPGLSSLGFARKQSQFYHSELTALEAGQMSYVDTSLTTQISCELS
jgi:hypothetical protein